MFNHLKVGFQSPDDVIVWRRDFRSRWTDNRKKAVPTTPRMTTPEIRALVIGFIGWELAGGAGKWSVENRHLKEFIHASVILHEFASIFVFVSFPHMLSHLVNYHKFVF